MKALYSKMVQTLGIPVILFVIALLLVNFFYVNHQLKELSYVYVDGVAREVHGKLTGKIKAIEKLAKILASNLSSDSVLSEVDSALNEVHIGRLLNGLLDDGEKYDIFIVHKPWVIEGGVHGGRRPHLQQRRFNGADESKYQQYLKRVRKHDLWGRISSEGRDWRTDYIAAFKTTVDHADGVAVLTVQLSDLFNGLFQEQASKHAKIVLFAKMDTDQFQALLLDPQTATVSELSDTLTEASIRPLVGDLPPMLEVEMDSVQLVGDLPSVLEVEMDSVQLGDLVGMVEQAFISQQSSILGSNIQLTALLPQNEVFLYLYRAKFVETLTVLAAFLGLLLLIRMISKSIARPISALTGKVALLAGGNLNVRFPETNACRELSSLSENLNRTVEQLQNYFADLKRVTARNEKINSELNIARNVQMSLLPGHAKHAATNGIDIHAYTLPAREVGGDFYYFCKIDRDRTAVLIGDVSGKGLPAALVMAVCLSLFKAQSMNTPQPGECLQKINQMLMSEDSSRGTFISLFYALIDTASGELNYANAGHNPPLIVRKNDGVEFLEEHSVALAVLESARYSTHKCKLARDDILVLYTDGITEAYDRQAEEFGEQRLVDCLRQFNHSGDVRCARRCAQTIIEHVTQWTQACVQYDDMTLLCAVVRGMKHLPEGQLAHPLSASSKISIAALDKLPSQHRITIPYDSQEIDKVIALIDSFSKDYRLHDELAADLCVVADELISNIIRYNEVSEERAAIAMRIAQQDDSLLMVLEYCGQAFDPTQQPPNTVYDDWRTRRVGGLGIHIVSQLTDRMSYAHRDGRNILVVEKILPS